MVSLAFLASLNLPFWKVPSGEITNVPYLRAIASTGKPVIISTGMANLSEVEFALNIFLDANYARDQVTLLHCTTEYPAPIEDVNLRAMVTMREAFGTLVGYSDHTNGIEASIAAVALGATVIEKHFTLDRTLPGPDHAASLEPEELSEMVRCIRNVEVARGSGIKNPTERELGNLVIARKGIYASRPIRKGERFSQENLICKRPLKGLSASMWDLILGRVASRNFEPEEPVDF